MLKPRLFKIHLALEGSGFGALAGAAVANALGKKIPASVLSVAGLSLLGSASAIQTVRSEKESQRNAGRAGEQRTAFNKLAGDIGSGGLSAQTANADALLMQLKQVDQKLEHVSSQLVSRESSARRSSVSVSSDVSSLKLDFAEPPFAYLPAKGRVADISVKVEGCTALKFSIGTRLDSDKSNAKAGLIAFAAYDQAGERIDVPLTSSRSEKFGYFSYLAGGSEHTTQEITIQVLPGVDEVRAEIHSWSEALHLQNEILLDAVEAEDERKLSDLKVASILDEFSFQSFEPECNLLSLDPKNWKEQMDEFRPDLFFCESAWSGADSDARPWKGKVYTSVNFQGENRNELLGILEYCKRRGIPTVFWNKEDPSHYDDRVHDFVDTALKFDHLFTTDINCVARYKSEYGHPSVDVLPFAVQPRLFNPIEIGPRSDEVVFAGGWYANHRQRSEDTITMFDAVLSSGLPLKIYDRFYSFTDDETHVFPEKYRELTNPAVPATEMPAVYKESRFGMTLNTETLSPTMFARRIFELMASNTYVFSNYSRGIAEMFPGTVSFLDKDPDALKDLTENQVDEARRANLLEVLENHTYRNRFKQIVAAAGITVDDDDAVASVGVIVESVEEALASFEILRRVGGAEIAEKSLLVTGVVDPTDYSQLLRDFNRDGVRVVWLPSMLQADVDSAEILGDAPSLLLVTAAELDRYQRDIAYRIGRFELHRQYSEMPIVPQHLDFNPFTEIVTSWGEVYVPKEKALHVLQRIDNGQNFAAYVVEEL